MPGPVYSVFLLSLLWAIVATEAAVEGKGRCMDSDAIIAIYTDTQQFVGIKKHPKAKRMSLYASHEFDDPNNLPDTHLFCLTRAKGTKSYYISPNIDEELVLQVAKKSGKLTFNRPAKKVKTHQIWDMTVHQEFSTDPLAQCLSFQVVDLSHKGKKLTTVKLTAKRSSKLSVSNPGQTPEDPNQSYNIIQVN